MKNERKPARRRRTAQAGPAKAKPATDYLADHERGIQPGIKYHPKRMAMQAAPDHGDHE